MSLQNTWEGHLICTHGGHERSVDSKTLGWFVATLDILNVLLYVTIVSISQTRDSTSTVTDIVCSVTLLRMFQLGYSCQHTPSRDNGSFPKARLIGYILLGITMVSNMYREILI